MASQKSHTQCVPGGKNSQETRSSGVLVLVDLILSIPSTSDSVEAEPGFSQMKVIKNDWRSRLHDSSLSDLMMAAMETPDIQNFDPTPAIHLWMNLGSRSRRPEHWNQPSDCSTEAQDEYLEIDPDLACEQGLLALEETAHRELEADLDDQPSDCSTEAQDEYLEIDPDLACEQGLLALEETAHRELEADLDDFKFG